MRLFYLPTKHMCVCFRSVQLLIPFPVSFRLSLLVSAHRFGFIHFPISFSDYNESCKNYREWQQVMEVANGYELTS